MQTQNCFLFLFEHHEKGFTVNFCFLNLWTRGVQTFFFLIGGHIRKFERRTGDQHHRDFGIRGGIQKKKRLLRNWV